MSRSVPGTATLMASTATRRVVFRVEYGGLGDHLFFSALPRLLKERRLADEVLISDASPYRDPAIFDLVWRHNPFLDGVSADPPTPLPVVSASGETKIVNIIFARFGLHSPEEFPVEIHERIPLNPAFDDHFIDLNYVSFVGAFTPLDKIAVYRRHPDHVLVNPDRLSRLVFPRRRMVFTASLHEYASLIASARSFVTLASGGATLAAALHKPSIVYHGHGQSTVFHHGMHRTIRIGGTHLLRRAISRAYGRRNDRRLARARNR